VAGLIPLTLKLALSPLLAMQAVRLRRAMPRLPEAEGERDGMAGRGGAAAAAAAAADR
jgi:hypothetical protein